jgi:hypothetical protein
MVGAPVTESFLVGYGMFGPPVEEYSVQAGRIAASDLFWLRQRGKGERGYGRHEVSLPVMMSALKAARKRRFSIRPDSATLREVSIRELS